MHTSGEAGRFQMDISRRCRVIGDVISSLWFKRRQMVRSKTQKLIKRKAQKVLATERQYWARHDQLLRTFEHNAEIAGIPRIEPKGMVSRVFGFRDACVLVRFKRVGDCGFQVFDFDAPSSKWQDLVSIPVEHDGEIVELSLLRPGWNCGGLLNQYVRLRSL